MMGIHFSEDFGVFAPGNPPSVMSPGAGPSSSNVQDLRTSVVHVYDPLLHTTLEPSSVLEEAIQSM